MIHIKEVACPAAVEWHRFVRSLQAEAAVAHRFTVGAFAIIFDRDQRVLLCHRPGLDVRNLPGGGVEKDEVPSHAAIRETREECGYEVVVEALAGIYAKPGTGDLALTFRCVVTGGYPCANDEADRIEWFALDRLPGTLLPRHRERIMDATGSSSLPWLKSQLGPSSRDVAGHWRSSADTSF